MARSCNILFKCGPLHEKFAHPWSSVCTLAYVYEQTVSKLKKEREVLVAVVTIPHARYACSKMFFGVGCMENILSECNTLHNRNLCFINMFRC